MTSVEEGRNNLDYWFARTIDVTFDLNDLASIAVSDGDDVHLCVAHITDLQRLCAFHHAEAIGQVDELQ